MTGVSMLDPGRVHWRVTAIMTNSCHYLRAVTLLTVISSCLSALKCSVPRQSSMRFAITSRRNLTGHWEAEVNLKHSAGSTTSVEQDSGPWEVDVEQTSSRCGAEEEIVLAALVKAPPPRAGPGYETIHGLGYYKLHTELNTWEEARRVCAEEGAHLAVVNSKVEMDVILNIWGRHPKIMDSYLNSFAHVGFHDLYTEGNYLTVLGDSLLSTGFVPWGTNEPNNLGGSPGEDCGSLLRDGKLNDINCDTKLAYFCEQESW
uniref:C-type lectin domain-containing protein n=1 Tax=Timema poppense TaxID=170557 RepID=A0A7R9CU06_TIMPO|nr:unnamed protein product [Timema poppensis]